MPIFHPRKILVPMDLSDAAMTGWRLASSLGEKFGAKVEAIYVQDWLYAPLEMEFDPAVTEATRRRVLADVRARLGADAVLHAAMGSPEQEILSWGGKRGFDLIVMGTHGRTGFERAIKGSVAEAIVRHANVPVLVARGASARFRSILAPVNLEPYSWNALLLAASAARAFSARLVVLHVVGASLARDAAALAGIRERLTGFVARLPAALREACRPQVRLAFGDPPREIASAAGEADLVVLTAHRKRFLSSIVLGTTAERVMRHSPKSVLAVPSSPPARLQGRKHRREIAALSPRPRSNKAGRGVAFPI